MEKVYLSLGSNIGDRQRYLDEAVQKLTEHAEILLLKKSSYYETSPVGGIVQDDFINMAVEIETTLTVPQLLDVIHTVEHALNRQRKIHWGPRTIDIDIIFYGEQEFDQDDVHVPHKEAFNRYFVLRPIAELIVDESPLRQRVKAGIQALEQQATGQTLRKITTGIQILGDGSLNMVVTESNPMEHSLQAIGIQFDEVSGTVRERLKELLRHNLSVTEIGQTSLLAFMTVFELRNLITTWPFLAGKEQLSKILERNRVIWSGKKFTFDLTFQPIVYSIINITPDSFYDGAPQNLTLEYIEQRVRDDLAAGADVIEFGGKSSRPGYEDISPEVEWQRLAEPLRAIRATFPAAVIAIDTDEAYVMEQALLAGADIINDIDGFDTEVKLAVLAKYHPAVVVMNNGRAGFTHADNVYDELPVFFAEKQAELLAHGLQAEQIVVDPGVGFFDKRNVMDSVERMKTTGLLTKLGLPVMIAISRKSFMSKVFNLPVAERLYSTLIFEQMLLSAGGRIIRAHDTRATRLLVDGYVEYQEH